MDHSGLNPEVTLLACPACGMAYNEVPDPAALNAYYMKNAVTAHCQGGDARPTEAELQDQAAVFKTVEPWLKSQGGLWADVGCGRGGLLFYLRNQGLKNLLGLDLSVACLDYLRSQGLMAVSSGVDNLPLAEASVDVLSYCQVWEHVYDLNGLMRAARRALKPEGLIFVEVPDAEAYGRSPRNNCFQWLIPEHINHFDSRRLALALTLGGFELIAAGRRQANRNTPADFPVAWALARPAPGRAQDLKAPAGDQTLSENLKLQIQANFEYARPRAEEINRIAASGRPVWLWALSAAFWYFYGETDLRQANIKALIDINENFSAHTLDGRPILQPPALSRADKEDLAILFSHTQRPHMESFLNETGFAGQILPLV
ncbi:class I SAM-dependent methyltransferase [Deltaproteobacteria bacterium OttesenSCG-928-K17]|nr:class I SAM-dependent methyltransferase [Deltaproteobacteria bacterium OttesenSCG-928-K17]